MVEEPYRLKDLFDDFWVMQDPSEAGAFLQYWCDLAREAAIAPFIAFANTVQAHWSGIVNYIAPRISNGILEGINSKIQLAKRRAAGCGLQEHHQLHQHNSTSLGVNSSSTTQSIQEKL